MTRSSWMVVGVVALAAGVFVSAQEREDRTLLPQAQMTAIINEASGERAMHTILEMVPYQRVRLPSEYDGTFRESEVMARLPRNTASVTSRSKYTARARPGSRRKASCG